MTPTKDRTSPFSFQLNTTLPSQNQDSDVLPSNSTDLSDCRLLEFLPQSNPNNVISFQNLVLFFRALGGVLVPWIAFCGIPMNVVNFVVFFNQGLKERINLLLFLLAWSDFVVSAYLFLSTIEYFTSQVDGEFGISGPLVVFVMKYAGYFYGFVYVSGLISTLIAFERCICITYPFVAKQVMKTETMCVGVSVVSVFLVVSIYIVSGQKYQIICGYLATLKFRLKVYYPTDLYIQNKNVMDVLNILVNGISLPSFFVFTTTISSIITAMKLKSAAAWRQTTSSVTMETKEMALTKMLIVVSCLFIACTVPNVILRIGPVIDTEFKLGGRHQNLLLAGLNVLYAANAINSSFNFLFYWMMGSRFRTVLKDLICRSQGDSKRDAAKISKNHRHQR